jgi:hypothetical protein
MESSNFTKNKQLEFELEYQKKNYKLSTVTYVMFKQLVLTQFSYLRVISAMHDVQLGWKGVPWQYLEQKKPSTSSAAGLFPDFGSYRSFDQSTTCMPV